MSDNKLDPALRIEPADFPRPVEEGKRSPTLKPFLREVHTALRNLYQSGNASGFAFTVNLSSAIYPWLYEGSTEEYDSNIEKQRFVQVGINGDQLLNQLTTILSEDSHLKLCCVSPYFLATCLDLFYDSFLPDAFTKDVTDEDFDQHFQSFSDVIYAEPFRAQAYSHIFNFESELGDLHFGELNVIKLSRFDIARLLGEPSPLSSLHPFGAGEHFLYSETKEMIPNDWEWAYGELLKAEEFARVLQYSADGTVHLNYTSIYFFPRWVNRVRKNGIFLLGTHRRFAHEQGTRPFVVDSRLYEELLGRFDYYSRPEIAEKFADNRNALGKVIEFAGTYFESSHTQTEDARRLMDLALALEAIFHPNNSGEITFQISQLAAQFIGRTPEEKKEIFADVKKMYDKRSKLVHGSSKAQSEGFLDCDQIEKWSSLIRRALLGLIALYLRGETDHKAIVNQIEQSALDPQLGFELRRRSDPDIFAAEAFG
jgi:hypothetical protein